MRHLIVGIFLSLLAFSCKTSSEETESELASRRPPSCEELKVVAESACPMNEDINGPCSTKVRNAKIAYDKQCKVDCAALKIQSESACPMNEDINGPCSTKVRNAKVAFAKSCKTYCSDLKAKMGLMCCQAMTSSCIECKKATQGARAEYSASCQP